MTPLLFIVCAYALGSISFAIVVSRLMGLNDPRTFGSQNPGATNVLRTGKKWAAALTLLGDAGKGWLAVFLAHFLASRYGLSIQDIAWVGLAVMVGHIYPIFFKFQGGKGVATALGILLAIHPLLGLATLATWLLIAFGLKISSLAALLAAMLAPIYAVFLVPQKPFIGLVIVLSILLIHRHKKNIVGLLTGTESKIGRSSEQDKNP